jgi:hypothetical protein
MSHAPAFDTLRVGHCYTITNYGETVKFTLLEIVNGSEYRIKNLETLEIFNLFDLLKYGKGKDFDLFEIG